MRDLVRDEGGLALLDRGSGAPALLLIHGWGGTHTHFSAQIEHFAQKHRVLAPDLRGCGGSAQLTPTDHVETFAEDLLTLCARRGCEEVVAVGHSLGGAIALALGATGPDLVRGAVLVDAAVFFPERALPRIDRLIDDLAGADPHLAATRYAEKFLFLPDDPAAIREEVLDGIRDSHPQSLHGGFAAVRAFDAPSTAARVRCPVLEIDAARPFLQRDALRAVCPQVTFEQVDDAGHHLMQLAPSRVNRLIEDFLESLSSE